MSPPTLPAWSLYRVTAARKVTDYSSNFQNYLEAGNLFLSAATGAFFFIKTHKNIHSSELLILRAKLQGRGEPEISAALTGGLSGPQNWLSRSGSGQLIFDSDVREQF